MKRILCTLLSMNLLLISSSFSQTAYEVIMPDTSSIEHQITNNLVDNIYHVANASLQLSSVYDDFTLNAFVYNDLNGEMYVDIVVLDSFSNIISTVREYVNDKSFFPDVIIRDNVSGLGDSWIVTIIYNRHDCPSNDIYISEFKVDNPATLTSNPLGSFFVDEGVYPKIDGFIDDNFTINGRYFAMLDYAIAYNNLSANNNIEIRHFDANSVLLNSHFFTGYKGYTPDIAGITLLNANTRYVYVIDSGMEDAAFFKLFLYDFTNMNLISVDTVSYISLSPFFRIDAFTLIDDFLHEPRYVFSGGHDNFNHHFVSDYLRQPSPSSYFQLPMVNVISSSIPGSFDSYHNNYGHGVAAGVGKANSIYGTDPNHNDYLNTFSFTSVHSFQKENSFTNMLISTWNRNGMGLNQSYGNTTDIDLFKVNNNDYTYANVQGIMLPKNEKQICTSCSTHYSILRTVPLIPSYFFSTSIATQPNMGKYTVACWIDDLSNEVRFKQTNTYTNQGTSIFSQKIENPQTIHKPFTIYPVPADRDIVHIKADETISDVNIYSVNGVFYGKHLSTATNHISIDISKYKMQSKILFLEFWINGVKYTEKLVLF